MLWRDIKEYIVGNPLKTEQIALERIRKLKALAVLSSDALSSNAYATEEILRVLMLAGAVAMNYTMGICLAITALLVIVTISYRQVIVACPGGGGAYIVGKDQLGVLPGLTAGAALMIDYVLTVAVSVSAGIAAITSAFPSTLPWTVPMCMVTVIVIMLLNLRGIRESATVFALPTYVFIVCMYLLVGAGFVLIQIGYGVSPEQVHPLREKAASESLSLFLILRAFSSGCAALTGLEAISNSVTAFREPAAENANKTMTAMVVIMGTVFVGLTYLTYHFVNIPNDNETIISQLAREIFGGGFIYYTIQAATALILVLAANTSYTGFPRLVSLIAQDGYLPRQLTALGDRLVFSNGIVILSAVSIALIIPFRGNTNALIPLYAVGVFLSFTIAQVGMVKFWYTHRGRYWEWRAAANLVGGIATGVVTVIIASTKFIHGAWIVCMLIPCIMAWFLAIKRHYTALRAELAMPKTVELPPMKHKVVLLIAGVHKGIVNALRYAKTIASDGDACALYISHDAESTKRMQENWDAWNTGMPLVVIDSRYRSVLQPVATYLEYLEMQGQYSTITVVLPEFIVKRWWHHLLHNQTALTLMWALRFRRRIIVTTVPHHLRV